MSVGSTCGLREVVRNREFVGEFAPGALHRRAIPAAALGACLVPRWSPPRDCLAPAVVDVGRSHVADPLVVARVVVEADVTSPLKTTTAQNKSKAGAFDASITRKDGTDAALEILRGQSLTAQMVRLVPRLACAMRR